VKNILEVRDITKKFPGVVALNEVSIDFAAGEVHALVGENGAGKSTLIKIIGGKYHPDSGKIFFNGQPTEIADPQKAMLMGISIVYQEYNLIPKLTVLENVVLGREPEKSWRRVDWSAARARVEVLLERMGITLDLGRYVAELGAAEAKIVEILKALFARAELLIMDEPTAALPEQDVESLFRVVHSLRQAGVSVIYISHRIDEIFSVADRVSVLKDGELVGTYEVKDLDHDRLIRSMVGRELRDLFPAGDRGAGGRIVLSAQGLRDARVLKDVSLELRAGEILGIGGMTGNGQRELIRALFGAHPLTAGRIRVMGREVELDSPLRALRLGIGFIPDDRRNEGLNVTQSVGRNIALPSLHLRQLAGVIQRAREKRVVEEVIRSFDIKVASSAQPAQSMSGGNQQRVVIGKWLPLKPRILLFHEPTLGIDVGAKAAIYGLMRRLTAEGVAILMVTSDMIELLNVPDRIVVFWNGRITAEFFRAEATEEAVMFAASGKHDGQSA
jgi:ribose transport system ATP-binding protein